MLCLQVAILCGNCPTACKGIYVLQAFAHGCTNHKCAYMSSLELSIGPPSCIYGCHCTSWVIYSRTTAWYQCWVEVSSHPKCSVEATLVVGVNKNWLPFFSQCCALISYCVDEYLRRGWLHLQCHHNWLQVSLRSFALKISLVLVTFLNLMDIG